MSDFAWSLLLVGLCVLFALVLRPLQWWIIRSDLRRQRSQHAGTTANAPAAPAPR
ncbi:hypothetical protein [Amycolatopsis saalfeldensis]|uniref:Cellulose biosynthesis protein BcsF n=1 Tax=Amycolatopsis saalfeldensis TaxID=394193 RepID=A0A1H8T6P3_9PSEU|nr:hypothetical protein [Amycolatopsis saalfeldensis]SEO86680.1 hypothetical protein SAMN04489732_102458 [Amycolatopsis saalfeldensis]